MPSQQEIIRAAKEQGWSEGYQAFYEGQQRHNPYRQEKRDGGDLHEGPYGVGNSQPYT